MGDVSRESSIQALSSSTASSMSLYKSSSSINFASTPSACSSRSEKAFKDEIASDNSSNVVSSVINRPSDPSPFSIRSATSLSAEIPSAISSYSFPSSFNSLPRDPSPPLSFVVTSFNSSAELPRLATTPSSMIPFLIELTRSAVSPTRSGGSTPFNRTPAGRAGKSSVPSSISRKLPPRIEDRTTDAR